MVVLLILSVMAVIALPDITGFASRKNLQRQGDEFISVFHRTRDLAMDQGITWRILFQPEEGRFSCFGDEDADSQVDPTEKQLGPYVLADGILYGSLASTGPNKSRIPEDGVSFVNNRTSFSYMGCCNAGTVYLKSQDRALAIRLLPSSGTVRMWEYDGTWKVMK